ncbi:UNVERIFIED_CONTAM: hypothetical protein NCL1_08329 [Trichonephila clavipes]
MMKYVQIRLKVVVDAKSYPTKLIENAWWTLWIKLQLRKVPLLLCSLQVHIRLQMRHLQMLPEKPEV